MKTINAKEDYTPEMKENNEVIVSKYISLVLEYFDYVNKKKKKKTIILKGLEVIRNIFNMVLLYTKDLNAACNHTSNAILYYNEFLDQIHENGVFFFQLTTTDAIIYVYKKTICQIIQRITLSEKEQAAMTHIHHVTNVYNYLLSYMIHSTSYARYDFPRFEGFSKLFISYYIQQTHMNEMERLFSNIKHSSSQITIKDVECMLSQYLLQMN